MHIYKFVVGFLISAKYVAHNFEYTDDLPYWFFDRNFPYNLSYQEENNYHVVR